MPLHLVAGEIGVPMIMLDQYDISLGDTITVRSNGIRQPFTVAAYVYDGMILLFAKKVLKQARTKTIVDLLVRNDGFNQKTKVKAGLHQSKRLSANALIGLQEVRGIWVCLHADADDHRAGYGADAFAAGAAGGGHPGRRVGGEVSQLIADIRDAAMKKWLKRMRF